MTQAGESVEKLPDKAKLQALVNCMGDRNGLDLSSIEIAEALWLATKIEPAASFSPAPAPSPTPSSGPGVLPPPQKEQSPSLASPPSDPNPSPTVKLAASMPKAGVLPSQTLPVWLADPAMLTNALEIIRALKPLIQQVDVGLSNRLDEAATVETIARTHVCLPVLEADQEPWFDIIVVVDQGSSMQIWKRLVKDLVHILKWYGLFRNVQVFDLDIQPPGRERVLLRSRSQRGHRPSELADQKGQRIAIVLSDCAGAYWWDGTLLPMLRDWGRAMPMVVWQMLPEWMWSRTALGRGTAAALTNRIPGAANQQLQVRSLDHRGRPSLARTSLEKEFRIPAPVVTSDVRNLRNWSLMVAGDRRETTPGFLLPSGTGEVPKAKPIEQMAADRVNLKLKGETLKDGEWENAITQEIETIASERVQQFRKLSSPKARRLVMLLAAAPVITLPVVRLIRDSMMPDERSPLPVAEVFLSGLLQRVEGQEAPTPALPLLKGGSSGKKMPGNWDAIQYDFVPNVRKVLLELLPTVDTVDVVNSVSAAVARRWNQLNLGQSFRAFLLDPQVDAPEGLDGLRSFASVTAEILAPLGGSYTQFAQRLRQGIRETKKVDEDDFSDLLLKEFKHKSTKLVALPGEPSPIALTKATVRLDNSTDYWAGLENVEVRQSKVMNLMIDEVKDPSVFDPLEPFLIRIATVEHRGAKWVVNYAESEAHRYVETLPDDISLDLVKIPSGDFVMGSSENEPERSNTRETQHQVTIAYDFLMGRYPVTQAQWRVVASSLPQVDITLDPDPSNFKGDDRPVETVSWREAVEFCQRLNRYVEGRSIPEGYEYRLPSEAEWEYACRADTTTPFHFGPMITTEVANYSGSSYDSGPTGKMRGETNPVTEFNHANQFGLSDMHGNVWEWCLDEWHENYGGAPLDGSAWLENTLQSNNERVWRGGSWIIHPRHCRSAYRNHYHPGNRYNALGFRVVLAPHSALPSR